MGQGSGKGPPLAGIRITDFTWAWAGPHGTLLLGMLGAEVIKIESRTRLDHSRMRSLMGGATKGGPDDSPLFNDLNLNKLSLTLDLRKEESRAIVRRLVAKSDVAVQNMRPGVLDRLGLGYEDLRAVKPDIIMLSSSAVGAVGPERAYAGYAPTFASMSGAAHMTGYPDGPPIPLSGSVDLRVGTAAAFGVLAALYHRQQTGEGQNIDLSSTEVMSSMIGDAFLEYGMTGRVPVRVGNRDSIMAPHGCYRCENGEWVSIAVGSADEWAALRRAIADPALDDAAFAGPLERWRNQERLDEIVDRWTRERDPAELVEALQRAGVPSMRVHTGESIASDPHVLERGVLTTVTHPKLGERFVVGAPWRFSGDGVGVRRAAPLLGEHNRYVLGEILGMPDEEIERLREEGVLN
ncbi:MAG: CaiB/BaiF CoA transferase family protein [Planctomycetota bacterium]|jgi:benzylsuccinate CoA-transferase BbsF subunit